MVLGLVTTKDGKLEDPAAVEARIREASKFVPLERLALSPQCGFASGEYADTMTMAAAGSEAAAGRRGRAQGVAEGITRECIAHSETVCGHASSGDGCWLIGNATRDASET